MGTIWIGSDHGGYALKQAILQDLRKRQQEFKDVGSESEEIVRYPYFAAQVAAAVSRGEAWRGILICSTGIGMSIIANRYKGVRASMCTTGYLARMTRAHNDSNLLCLGGKTTGEAEALDILDQWLKTEFEGGRHLISLGMIKEAEESMCLGDPWETDDPHV